VTLPFTPRPSQREILAYRGGALGIQRQERTAKSAKRTKKKFEGLGDLRVLGGSKERTQE